MSANQSGYKKRSGGRAVRRKTEVTAELSITSLLDVLTIILVFLIKNVSMEAVKIAEIPNMKYPSSISTEALIRNPEVVPVKIYPDKVELGVDNLYFGTPDDLGVEQKWYDLQKFFLQEMDRIPADKKEGACVVLQADASVPCLYVTEIVRIATSSQFPNIYFATVEDPDWLSSYRPDSL